MKLGATSRLLLSTAGERAPLALSAASDATRRPLACQASQALNHSISHRWCAFTLSSAGTLNIPCIPSEVDSISLWSIPKPFQLFQME